MTAYRPAINIMICCTRLLFALTKRATTTRWCIVLAIALQTILTVFLSHSHSHHHYDGVTVVSNSMADNNSSATTLGGGGGGNSNKKNHHNQHAAAADAVVNKKTKKKKKKSIIIDILSIGSIYRPQLQDTQERTFGSHEAVRRFVRVTERDDVSDPYCHAHLTMDDVKGVSQFCRRLRVSLTLKHKQQHKQQQDQQQQSLLHDNNETTIITTDDIDNNNTTTNVENIMSNNNKPYFHLKRMTAHYATFHWLSKKQNPTGWMCAQKRPIDGLAKLLQSYQQQQQQQQQQYTSLSETSNNDNTLVKLPDYLIVMDDDTWMNLDLVLAELLEQYPPAAAAAAAASSQPQSLQQQTLTSSQPAAAAAAAALAVAGCRIRSVVRVHNFTIPFGGWGIILNRAALQNLMRPITCRTSTHDNHHHHHQNDNNNTNDMDNDDFVRNACHRISQDNIGEGRLFTNGMTVLNLMQAYAKHESYLQQTTSSSSSSSHNKNHHPAWVQSLRDVHAPPRFGYCLHSDWAWGYWINFYNIAIHSTEPIITTASSSSSSSTRQATATTRTTTTVPASTLSAAVATPNVAVTDGEEASPAVPLYFASLPSSMFADVPEDRLRAYQDTSTMQAGERTRHGQCLHNGNEQCTLQAHICHYVNETHMQALYHQQQQQRQRQ